MKLTMIFWVVCSIPLPGQGRQGECLLRVIGDKIMTQK